MPSPVPPQRERATSPTCQLRHPPPGCHGCIHGAYWATAWHSVAQRATPAACDHRQGNPSDRLGAAAALDAISAASSGARDEVNECEKTGQGTLCWPGGRMPSSAMAMHG